MYIPEVHEQILQVLGITQSTERSEASHLSPQFSDKHNQKKSKRVLSDGAVESDCAKLKKLHEMLP